MPEILDDPGVSAEARARSLADVARSNRLFGGLRAVLAALGEVYAALPRTGATLLDVGTGAGDIPGAARAHARRHGITLTTIGLDLSFSLVSAGRERIGLAVCGDAFRLPFADRSVDVVTCSQVLHHFTEEEGAVVLSELHRVARQRVIVSDLQRSRIAAAGFWLASFPLGFHPITRHDGPVSVMRGFSAAELRALVRRATGTTPVVFRRLGWRLVASWAPLPDAARRATAGAAGATTIAGAAR